MPDHRVGVHCQEPPAGGVASRDASLRMGVLEEMRRLLLSPTWFGHDYLGAHRPPCATTGSQRMALTFVDPSRSSRNLGRLRIRTEVRLSTQNGLSPICRIGAAQTHGLFDEFG